MENIVDYGQFAAIVMWGLSDISYFTIELYLFYKITIYYVDFEIFYAVVEIVKN